MDYTTLIGAKTLAGSIKRDVNYDQIDPAVILEDAQAFLYQTLRTREMRSLASLAMSVGDSTKALPTGFLEPIGKLRDTANYHYTQITEDNLLRQRVYDSSGAIQSGQPSYWTILNELIQFDFKFDSTKTLLLTYYKIPTALGTGNTTNFLTSRYPHLLRQACKVQSHAFMKNWSAYQAELPILATIIEKTNAEADMTYRGADYDQE